MSPADLTTTHWNGLDDHQALHHVERPAQELSSDLLRLEQADYAGRRFRRALFHRDDTTCTLVPGGEAQVGFAPARFTPTAE
ncbi:hypothetical protein [Planomonospora venezuelensis]|uniref:Uncharacterized protein n=1 Tax=Planomonospora venezuelensis TaxID=1999 RepID=A0A841DG85_PLAVE|nr:hypothetical protein [Planomonospora venezuelensis]MBB5967733.1 hypothetical protein [Planomonospora venezuelensis]GIN03737.1 hypothetical protein Pve01_53950 [Planomonospora venezuelensis]